MPIGKTHEELSIDLMSSENQGDLDNEQEIPLTYHDKIKMNLPPLLDAEAKRRMKKMQDANKTAGFKMDFIKESPNEQESSQFPNNNQAQSLYQAHQSDLLSNLDSMGKTKQEFNLTNESKERRVIMVNRPFVDEKLFKIKSPFIAPKPVLESKKLLQVNSKK